ncbi:MAG: hypothetical protein APR54_04250 [Candidatus Cloacimonas sp. SDB]|nr:MAG: hypothetical protein APR54_04250 [Candidatus Cloacimonas sp. SDB]
MSKRMMILIMLIIISSVLFGAEKYAVLITGDYADERGNFDGSWAVANGNDVTRSPMEEFWHDTFLMWELLINKGYSNENIFVLFAGGQDFQDQYIIEGGRYVVPLEYDPITDYQADLANVEMVLEGLAYGNQQEDIPQLQSDDFLTIWTFDHGDWHSGHRWLCLIGGDEISDEAFGNLVDQINCQKKVVFMQQCFSGGFVPFLENEHSIVFTAANDHMYAFRDDSLYYDGIDYPGDPDPGNSYWAYERDVWAGHEYRHGEYNFHLMNALKNETPAYDNFYHTDYGDFPLENADLNQDGLCSIFESSEWVKEFDSRQTLHWTGHYDDPQYYDNGGIGETTSLEYPNMISGEVVEHTTISGIVAVNGDLIIHNNSSLTVASGTKVYLKNRNRIYVESCSELNIEDNVVFYGETTTIPRDEFNPEDIPGNRIEIFGDLSLGNGVQFTVEDEEYWDGLYLYGNQTVNITNGTFNHCNLINENGELQLTDTAFIFSYLSNKYATLQIDNCDFSNFSNGIYCLFNPLVSIINSDIHDCNTGIILNSCSNYAISNCNVYNNSGMGIFVNESYEGENEITLTNIYNNSNDGIRFYASEGKVQSCNIYGNLRGILCYRGSIVEILKDPNSGSWIDDSIISNNDWEEILFIDDCTIIMDRNRNKIVDNSYISGSWDQYLARCPNMSHNRVWRGNYWGYNGIHGAVLPPENRFYPSLIDPDPEEIGFILSPVWDPGQPREGEEMLAETLYKEADLAVSNNNYSLADQLFKQIITLYPESEYAVASAKRLIEVSSNFSELQTYYETEPNLHYNEEMDKYADYLANYCNIKMECYEDAIICFEEIISNPPSEIDSVMAVIDAGYTYLLMEENGNRSGFVGTMENLKPNSRKDFEENQDQLLSELFGEPEQEPDIEPFGNNMPNIPVLVGNYPNPFNPVTTISFSIPEKSKVDLVIYNIKGQKVKALVNNEIDKGEHNVIWNGADESGKSVSSGVYFYKLSVNDKSKSVKKCLLLQ